MKTYPGQPPTLAQLPAQQRKIRRKFEYFLAGRAIASNEDMTQVGYCLGLKSSARPRGCICIACEPTEFEIVDLYSVGYEQKKKATLPFIHMLSLEGPKGEVVRIRGLFDDGALVNAMCSSVFEKVKKRLGRGIPSKRQLRMANGSVIPSEAH